MSISIQRVNKTFGANAVLHDVNLKVEPGELLALLGPSGCGKTTLLRLIAGLDRADSGKILIDDVDTAGLAVRERGVGFVFQHYALFRHMTVRENVAFGLRVRPRSTRPSEEQILDTVDQLLSRVQLEDLGGRFPSQLSGGQRQRVALARALAVNPRVLLLDEPFGALDARVRKDLRRWLRRLHEALRVTSVFVTHDQAEALELADRVVLMNAGRIEQVGTPDEVWKRPASPFAFGFLGDVNVLPGRLEDGGVRVGKSLLELPDQPAANGSAGRSVNVYVRPEELEVTSLAKGSGGLPAAVGRITGLGSFARLELISDLSGEGSERTSLEAMIPVDQLERDQLSTGSNVLIRARRVSIFPN
jgi:sulfate transport system ATP-binding protein